MAKQFATDASFAAASDAIAVHGGYGYSDEYPVERYLRNSRGAMIYEGTNEIHSLIQAGYALGTREDRPLRREMPEFEEDSMIKPFSRLLYMQLESGFYKYRACLFAASLLRIGIVVVLWSILLVYMSGGPTFIALTIFALIAYAFVEVASATRRIRAAELAMAKVDRGWDRAF